MITKPGFRWNSARRRGFAGWLAIVALLLDGLLPTGFSLAPPMAMPAIGFCGDARVPDNQPPLPPIGTHCIYCLVAPVGSVPPPMPALAMSQLVRFVVHPALRPRLPRRPAPFAAAQPRGPPATA